MGKRAWTTDAQRTWLESQIPDFVEAQQKKVVTLLLKDIYNKWEEKFPTPPLTAEELEEAENNSEKAFTIKRKAAETVRTHNENVSMLTFFMHLQQVKNWFHNHTRASSSGSGVRGVLKLSETPKIPQPWQAFLNLFQETTLKDSIEDAWKYYMLELPEGGKPEKTKFEVRNRVAQRLYPQQTDEVKEQVEKHRQDMVQKGDVRERSLQK
jgi:hypothetical protein